MNTDKCQNIIEKTYDFICDKKNDELQIAFECVFDLFIARILNEPQSDQELNTLQRDFQDELILKWDNFANDFKNEYPNLNYAKFKGYLNKCCMYAVKLCKHLVN